VIIGAAALLPAAIKIGRGIKKKVDEDRAA
jgi:hypothetical protein